MSENVSVTDKAGNKVYICNYRWVDSDGKVETCRAHKACEICGQCSRIDSTGHENGHCPGHLGLIEHIKVPGQEGEKVRTKLDNARQNRPQNNKHKRKDKRPVKVERKPSLRKVA